MSPFSVETGSVSGLPFRHRRFDSDRSLSPEDPCEAPETPGCAGVLEFFAARIPPTGVPLPPNSRCVPSRNISCSRHKRNSDESAEA